MSFVTKRREQPRRDQGKRHTPFTRRWTPTHDTPPAGLEVGSPHHSSERAADAFAAAAVDGAEVPLSVSAASPASDEARPLSDFKLTDNDIAAVRDQGGAALPRQLQSGFEAVHGGSVGDVRVHDNPRAHELSRALNASAFSVGNDIFFNRGSYHPRSRAGRRLLAHEVAHTTQARPGEQTIRRSSSKHPLAKVFYTDDGSQKSYDEIAQVIIAKLENNPEADGFVLAVMGAPLGLGLPNEWQQRQSIARAFFKKASAQLLKTLRSSRDGLKSYSLLSKLLGAEELAEVERRHGLPPVPPKAPKVAGDPAYDRDNFYRVDDLSSDGLTAEEAEFKDKVYKKAAKNSHSNHGEFVWGVPDADRGVIEGNVEAHKVVHRGPECHEGQANIDLPGCR